MRRLAGDNWDVVHFQARERLHVVDGTGTNLLLRIATQSGYNYVLQNATNLTPPVAWVSPLTNTGSGLTVTNVMPASRGTPKNFYRYTVQ